eukprot:3180306-Heterocapsa_arctica.AAC.1
MGAAPSLLVDVLDPRVEFIVRRLLAVGSPEWWPGLSLRGVGGDVLPSAGAEARAAGSHPGEAIPARGEHGRQDDGA